jgi:hypothetical protein
MQAESGQACLSSIASPATTALIKTIEFRTQCHVDRDSGQQRLTGAVHDVTEHSG